MASDLRRQSDAEACRNDPSWSAAPGTAALFRVQAEEGTCQHLAYAILRHHCTAGADMVVVAVAEIDRIEGSALLVPKEWLDAGAERIGIVEDPASKTTVPPPVGSTTAHCPAPTESSVIRTRPGKRSRRPEPGRRTSAGRAIAAAARRRNGHTT